MSGPEIDDEPERYIVTRHPGPDGGYAIVPAPENAARSWGSVSEAYAHAQVMAGWRGKREERPAADHARRFQAGGR